MNCPTYLLRELIEEINNFPISDEVKSVVKMLQAELPSYNLPEIIIFQLAKITVLAEKYGQKTNELGQKLENQEANVVFWCHASACANRQSDCQSGINDFLKSLREQIKLAGFRAEILRTWCDSYLELICP